MYIYIHLHDKATQFYRDLLDIFMRPYVTFKLHKDYTNNNYISAISDFIDLKIANTLAFEGFESNGSKTIVFGQW